MMRNRIDFVGVGAPKSGTTWISACLAEHPEIGFAGEKEVYYFADSVIRSYFQAGFNHYARGPEWYHRQFPASKPTARVFGEFTVAYMYDPRSADRIRDYHPDIRILAVLRNPVEMIYSWYWYNRTGVISDLPPAFEEAMAIPAFRDLGCYYRALRPFFDRFPPNQIKIVLYEDVEKDPQSVLRELFTFLGVDPDYRPEQTDRRMNPAVAVRFPLIQNAARAIYAALKRMPIASSLVTSRTVEKALQVVYGRLNRVAAAYPPIRPETRKELALYYREDIRRLEILLNRDLGRWNDADGTGSGPPEPLPQ